jgi:hypothetical protein
MDKNLELTARATIENALGRNNGKTIFRSRHNNPGGSSNYNGSNYVNGKGAGNSHVRISNAKPDPKARAHRPSGGSTSNKSGHDNKSMSRDKRSNVVCYKCEKNGHYARDCRSTKTPLKKFMRNT